MVSEGPVLSRRMALLGAVIAAPGLANAFDLPTLTVPKLVLPATLLTSTLCIVLNPPILDFPHSDPRSYSRVDMLGLRYKHVDFDAK